MLIPSPTEVEAMKNNLNLRDAQSDLGELKKNMLYTASRNSTLFFFFFYYYYFDHSFTLLQFYIHRIG